MTIRNRTGRPQAEGRASRALGTIAIAAAATLALSACTAPGDGPKDEADSPLTKYLTAIYGGGDEDEWRQRADEDSKKAEELVAACMNEAGFEYKPQTSIGAVMSAEEWKPEDEDWVAEYGYGIWNWPGEDDMDAQAEVGGEQLDPNAEYVESLSDSEEAAYWETLNGPPMEDTGEEDVVVEWDWTTSGCSGKAWNELATESPAESDEHKPLMDAVTEFYESSSTAPGLEKVNADWARCMAEKGEPGLASPTEAQESITSEQSEYYGDFEEFVEDPEAEKAFAGREVELALIDLGCREQTGYAKKAQDIQWKLEEEFIADHKAELEALMADAEAARQ